MNAIQANERLTVLEKAVRALETAIDDANRRQDIDSRYALQVIKIDVEEERDDLQKKLSEVQI